MSIEYTLVDTARRRIFNVGTHRDMYAEALKATLHDHVGGFWPGGIAGERFVALCVDGIRDAVTRFPGSFVDPNADKWAVMVELRARRVLKFAAETNAEALVLVHDAGDDMDLYDGWPEVGSVYG